MGKKNYHDLKNLGFSSISDKVRFDDGRDYNITLIKDGNFLKIKISRGILDKLTIIFEKRLFRYKIKNIYNYSDLSSDVVQNITQYFKVD